MWSTGHKWLHSARADDRRIDHRHSCHLSVPSYQSSVVKAKEAALRQDLSTLRDVLDQHKADQGKYPPSLTALMSAGYLRGIPKDPFTGATTTWQEISDPVEGGVVDIFSGAEFVGTNGTPYNRW